MRSSIRNWSRSPIVAHMPGK